MAQAVVEAGNRVTGPGQIPIKFTVEITAHLGDTDEHFRPQTVKANGLRAALLAASTLPTRVWYQDDDEDGDDAL